MLLRVARMDRGADAELFCHTLSFIPKRLLNTVRVTWYMPKDPVRSGLLQEDADAGYGLMYSQAGGWYWDTRHNNKTSGERPHIYLAHDCMDAATHEFGHAVDYAFGLPSRSLFRPELSLVAYGKNNSREYFACAFDIYFGGDWWGNRREDLRRADPDIFAYMERLELSC